MEDRLVELESRVAFQDDAVQKLAHTVAEQERQIFRLTREVELLRASLTALTPSLVIRPEDEAPPPHY
jgi:SlyX protein